MKPLIKSVWVTALRSGRYHQIRGYLKRGNGYDVLGVLCDLYREQLGERTADNTWVAEHPDAPWQLHGEKFVLPKCVQIWAGMRSVIGQLPGKVHYGHTRRLGDSLTELETHGATFEELATVIELLGEML